MKRWFSLYIGLAMVFAFSNADARPFRPGLLPNAPARCNTCHTSGGGSPRNAFGLAVEELVTPGGREEFWGPDLAALDSDGDGFTNGQELGDPDGDGVPDANAIISQPGNAESTPETVAQQPPPEPMLPPRQRIGLNVRVLDGETPLAGVTVRIGRSVSGARTRRPWSGTTAENGRAQIEIGVENRRNAGGYYTIRVTDSERNRIGDWHSIPLNGGNRYSVTVSPGQRAQVRLRGAIAAGKVAALSNSPNPFNPATQIRYTLDAAGVVRLTVFNKLGQEVARLLNASQAAGN